MKKLYASLVSNMGLILLAILATGIWTSNIQDFLMDKNVPQVSAAPSPLQGWPLMPDGELGQKVKAIYPGSYDDLPDKEVGRRVKAKFPQAPADYIPTPTPTPRKSAEETLGITPQLSIRDSLKARRSQPSPSPGLSASDRIKRIEEFLKSPPVTPTPFTNPGATAICRDRTYSFSQNRRGTCSHHGGVAVWLK